MAPLRRASRRGVSNQNHTGPRRFGAAPPYRRQRPAERKVHRRGPVRPLWACPSSTHPFPTSGRARLSAPKVPGGGPDSEESSQSQFVRQAFKLALNLFFRRTPRLIQVAIDHNSRSGLAINQQTDLGTGDAFARLAPGIQHIDAPFEIGDMVANASPPPGARTTRIQPSARTASGSITT